jgi:2-polyprenyl-6-methoxyphenol hydroxylase-like FAD-dependent oxidoreductase
MNGNEHATRTSGTTDRSPTEEVEVAVIGYGPTGLALAVMLSGYGIRTAVLDGAAGPARHSRTAVVHARTLEPLGVAGEMLGGASWFRTSACATATAYFSEWISTGCQPPTLTR